MTLLSRFLLLLTLCGGCSLLRAGDFSRLVPADSFLYVEARGLPGTRERMAETGAFESLEDLDWKDLILQLYEIGLASDEELDLGEDPLSTEDLRELLEGVETRGRELGKHLNGDIAFSMGNFRDVISVFRFNEKIRETMALTFDQELEGDDLNEEQLEALEARLDQETALDLHELNSLLGQFTFWADVKDGDVLETKLFAWLSELTVNINKEAEELKLTQIEDGPYTYYALGGSGENEPAVHWGIHQDVWVITFSAPALKNHLKQLDTPMVSPLSERPAYQEAKAFIGEVDSLVYWDFAPLDPLIRELLKEMPQEASEPIPFLGQLPTGEAVLNWLELDALLPYVLGSRLETEGIRTRGRYGFSRETALSRIAIDPEAGKAEIPGFIHKNFNQFASFNWHPGRGWSRLETELLGIAPQAAAVMGMGRMLASGQVGFDLKLQFMDHLNGSMLMVQTFDPEVTQKIIEAAKNEDPAKVMQVQMEHPTGGQNYLFALGMANEAGIREAFDRLLNRFHPNGIPDPVEFEGHELFYPVPEDFQGGLFHKLLSYTYLDGYFLMAIGDDQLLKDAVSASQDPELQMINDPDFKSLQSRLINEPGSFEYTSGEQQKQAMQMVQSSLTMLLGEDSDLEVPDLSVLAEMIHQTMAVSLRNGLVVEVDGFAEFPPEK